MEKEMMMQEQGVQECELPQGVVSFVDWAAAQGVDVALRVLGCVSIMNEVMSERRTVTVLPGLVLPDVWSMAQAAEVLRDMTQAAGFPEAAAFFEEERQFAADMIEKANRWLQKLGLPR